MFDLKWEAHVCICLRADDKWFRRRSKRGNREGMKQRMRSFRGSIIQRAGTRNALGCKHTQRFSGGASRALRDLFQ